MSENPYPPSEDQIKDAVNRTKTRAEEYLHDPDKSRSLLDQAVKKANKTEQTHSTQSDFWSQLKAFFRLLKAYINKEYTVVPWASIVLVTVAILYFVTPIDLILDWLPLVGYVDDAAVIVFVVHQIKVDLDKFQQWEATKDLPGQQIIDQ